MCVAFLDADDVHMAWFISETLYLMKQFLGGVYTTCYSRPLDQRCRITYTDQS